MTETGIYLESIEIGNFFSIKNPVKIGSLGDKREIYILGENGDGKTLILQAILMALKWRYILRETSKKETGRILDLAEKNSDLLIRFKDNQDREYDIKHLSPSHQNVFAYGVHRSRVDSERKDPYGFLTLFDTESEHFLQSPVGWLSFLYALELEHKQGQNPEKPFLSLETAKSILVDLLDKNVEIEVNAREVSFIERGTALSFDKLSEGYRTVLTWVCDLVSRLAENQPEAQTIKEFQGIVLVDEINLHLHPKWEYRLVQRLRHWFPRVQFFFTTHSPITILGASKDAAFFKVYKEEGQTKLKDAGELQLANMRLDQVLTSSFFGLESARPVYLADFMRKRKEILMKGDLTDQDKAELEKLEAENEGLPTGETIEELEAQALIQKIAKGLK